MIDYLQDTLGLWGTFFLYLFVVGLGIGFWLNKRYKDKHRITDKEDQSYSENYMGFDQSKEK